jgi:hypothetical protein
MPNPAAVTSWPTITGVPTIGPNAQGVWVLTGRGSMARTQPVVTMFISSRNQFYQKVLAHENKHVQQWQTGMVSDLVTVDGLWQAISGLSDATQQGLINKIQNAAVVWLNGQYGIADQRRNAVEAEAFSVSATIPPLYLNGC